MITFYLVRHGEAESNVRHILSSFPEKAIFHLTELGKKQVVETAQFLATVGADILLSSPMQRTTETAEIIAQAVNLPIVFDERLREAGFGVFNEGPRKEILKKYPNGEARISPDEEDGVESFLDIRKRLQGFLDDMKGKYVGKKMILVSHGDTLEQLHGILTNEAPGLSAIGWTPEKGSCTEIVWETKD